ncbi:nuclear transport factor 2 family protein [Billgrantia kenyensis]|uniref:Nuclear transport factor 2 family protein n=1 Tax=Billgrantia kenyensis TaxID=321266 RepID=A0A7V9W473_9GAMM|nr:nuclear transport factor 2 family protein [Halomonas kenyensis]MBA2780674.1 nuclear transport factor 2 family protein [Halomonas kenyensis]MCG6661222.1 nuclear transport factor 2 family protein [Halomonas kenyensis]
MKTAGEVVREFWQLMASNDFYSVVAVLAPDFVLEWPQSGERIRGGERFAQMNAEYPAHGRWQFTLKRFVESDNEVVTEVAITDGVQSATAISFFTVEKGRVSRLVEYWPEPYVAPSGRAHLVES